MKIQSLNEELFQPIQEDQMQRIVGGGRTKVTETVTSQTDGGDIRTVTLEYKIQDPNQ